MSPINKEYRIIAKFLKHIKAKVEATEDLRALNRRRVGFKSLQRVVAFYKKYNRWPSRTAEGKRERQLGYRFENLLSKESLSYNKDFRRLAMALGRTTNNKRKHDVQGFKKEILEFIKTHGRVPSTNSGETIEGEGRLRCKLDYYTKQCNDMTLLGQVYAVDKCHKSGIPMKFRAVINEALEIPKPLIRTV